MIHSDGPYALPGKPNPDGLPVLDRLDVGDAFWGFSIYDNCGDWHLHGTFNGHDDPDGGACGHGTLVYLGGAEPVQCGGLPADIVGTDGDDNIAGTSLGEVIHGLAGNDTIDGGGGPDTICGGPGDDTILGGDGDDKLLGGPGADDLFGQGGADEIKGNSGKDFLEGGDGKDRLFGHSGRDRLEGGDETISWTEAGIRTGW